jgi:hypothetical protein
MLSIAPGAHRFSPSQNIRVILPASHRIGNAHYRQYAPSCSQSRLAGRRGALSARIVFLLSRMNPSVESARDCDDSQRKAAVRSRVFLSKINGGRAVFRYGKNQVVYAQSDLADSVRRPSFPSRGRSRAGRSAGTDHREDQSGDTRRDDRNNAIARESLHEQSFAN